MTSQAAPNDDEASSIYLPVSLFQLSEAHRRFRSHLARALALSATDTTALLIIANSPGLSASSLAERLGLSSGAVTSAIDRLEDSGHAVRIPLTRDRRMIAVTLTNAGTAAVNRMWKSYQDAIGDGAAAAALRNVLPYLDEVTSRLNAHATRDPDETWPRHVEVML